MPIKEKVMGAIAGIVDRSDKLVNLATNLGVGYVGYKAFDHWSGALTALVGLRLAESKNLAAGAAGVGVLATLGVTAATKPFWYAPEITPVTEQIAGFPYWLFGGFVSLPFQLARLLGVPV